MHFLCRLLSAVIVLSLLIPPPSQAMMGEETKTVKERDKKSLLAHPPSAKNTEVPSDPSATPKPPKSLEDLAQEIKRFDPHTLTVVLQAYYSLQPHDDHVTFSEDSEEKRAILYFYAAPSADKAISRLLCSGISPNHIHTFSSTCYNARTLPDSVGQLSALTTLDLRVCESLTKLPDSVGQLSALTNLNLSFCESLTKLPDSVRQLSALTTLDLSGCKKLAALPESVGMPTALTTLNLTQCPALTGKAEKPTRELGTSHIQVLLRE